MNETQLHEPKSDWLQPDEDDEDEDEDESIRHRAAWEKRGEKMKNDVRQTQTGRLVCLLYNK